MPKILLRADLTRVQKKERKKRKNIYFLNHSALVVTKITTIGKE
jgi:hypothetical protein